MGNWKSKDPPLIRTEIKVGSAILIHVYTLTCRTLNCWHLHNAQSKNINDLAKYFIKLK